MRTFTTIRRLVRMGSEMVPMQATRPSGEPGTGRFRCGACGTRRETERAMIRHVTFECAGHANEKLSK